MMESRKEKDIWTEGIKSIMSYVKRSLLDYVDACDRQMNDKKTSEMLGKIKGRVHNDVSQGELMVGILFTAMKSGGDITEFQGDFRAPTKKDKFDKIFTKKPDNPVLGPNVRV